MAKLLYIGHSSFRLTTDAQTVIYIDPFKKGDYSSAADLVLVTHEHYDHNRTELVTLKEDGRIMRASDFLPDYKTATIKDVVVSAVPAYNKNHQKGCVGYVICADGLKLYFAGDTSETEYMRKLEKIDYAFLPTDGIYNMDVQAATHCAELIDARFCVPIHTDRPEAGYNEKTVAKFTPKNRFLIEPAREITLK